MDLYAALADERRAIAARLDTLTPEQWRTPSLCSSWTVHQMATHLLVSCDFTKREAALALLALAAMGGGFTWGAILVRW